MAIVFGTRSYGKVDKIADICHVATQFFHVQYVPLMPLRSYVVLEEMGDEFRGVQIPLSFKSILVAYLRAALFLGTFIIPFCFLMEFEHDPQNLSMWDWGLRWESFLNRSFGEVIIYRGLFRQAITEP